MFPKVGFILCLYLLLTGMRIILNDGNYIDVDSYYFHKGKVILKINNKVFELNEGIVDKQSTIKLNFLEQKKIGILKSYTGYYLQNLDKSSYFLKSPKDNVKKNNGNDTKIKLETRKEKSPFFSDENIKDENFIEKIQRKGIMIKIQLPVEENKK